MNIVRLFSRREWYSIFVASTIILLLLLLSLFSKIMLYIFIGLSIFGVLISCYYTFIKKWDNEENMDELYNMMSGIFKK